uniref:Uncharacterized protein n=1 Tax=viral metagenome TaxID=1070528 RepID=A0A6C0H719_9ZZZZ
MESNTTNNNTIDNDNINEIAHSIFTRRPGLPNSIQLQLEDVTADIAERQGVENFIFNILYLITHRGIEILFGHRKVHELTERQYQLVCEYVESYGYQLIVHANNTTETPWELIKQGKQLSSYQISFDRSF